MPIQRIWLTISSSALTVLLGLFLLAGPTPFSSAVADITNPGNGANCEVHAYHFDTEGAEVGVTGKFGPTLVATDEPGLRAELKERRSCGDDNLYDPALLGAQYVTTANATLPDGTTPANLTAIKVTWADVNPFIEQLATNRDLYNQVAAELASLEDGAMFSMEGVSRGTPTLYMTANDQSASKVTVKHGLTSGDGTNIVFTYANGATVKYRVECGGQPNFPTAPPGVPECVGEECAPPPVCPPGTMGTWGDCYVPCPPGYTGEREPDCYYNKWQTPSPTEPGWDPRGTDNGLTDGQESARQIESGETRGNAVNDQVSSDVPHTTTPDTIPSDQGGPVAGGGTVGGDNHEDDVQDEELVIEDEGGTEGAVCVETPLVTC